MLDTVPQRMAQKMPVDFATYLLSSSPPATNLELLSFAFSENARKTWTQSLQRENTRHQQIGEIDDVEEVESESVWNKQQTLPKLARNRLKPIIIKKDDLSSDGESLSNSRNTSGNVTPTSPCSPRLGKKVSFADHRGYALATVRIMTEASDQPPNLTSEILKSIKRGAKADAAGLLPFKLRFSQPASDYMAFRDRIDKNFVSLENVILRDYNVLGTVKVKNICFEKHIFIRCSFDSWESSHDIEAKFVPSVGCMSHSGMDTFSFEFDIETHVNSVIQFAVCYEIPGKQYWDNNSGENYQIVPTDFNAPHPPHNHSWTTDVSFQSQHADGWTQYGCWNHVDTSAPYY